MDDELKKTAEEQEEQMIYDAFRKLLDTYLASNHRKKVDIITRAFNFAKQAHKGVRRLSGEPYIMHPIAVAQIVCEEIGLGSTSICAALLHDVVEDTDTTLDDLAKIFPKEVTDAIALMTHDDSVPYLEYVKTIKSNPIASKVKLADLKHNSDLTRLDTVDDKALERVEKYKKAINILTC